MLVGKRRRVGRSRTPVRARRAFVGVAVVASLLLIPELVGGGASPGADMSARLVLSSLGHGSATAISTTSLYPRNDPWKAYLASESACPGGERIDLAPSRQRATVACLVNFARQRRGLRKLLVVAALNGASSRKAQEIVNCDNFSHDPCGRSGALQDDSLGHQGRFGENLYLATGRFGAPRVTVDAWLNSAPHRRNLFRKEWRGQGLAMLTRKSLAGYHDVRLWVSVLADR